MPPFADLLQELVAADEVAGLFGDGEDDGGDQAGRRRVERTSGFLMGCQKLFDPFQQVGTTGTSRFDKRIAFPRCGFFQGGQEDGLFVSGLLGHHCLQRTVRNCVADHPTKSSESARFFYWSVL